MPENLKAGDIAPDFELMNQDKKHIKLADFRGKKKIALLFYPMDFSPTCTQEHCSFGPEMTKLTPDGETVIFGVNADSPFTHTAYKKQYNIPYDLLSDPTRRMLKAYGMFAGEEPYNCAKRGTVIIDKAGKISFYQEVPMKEPRKVAELAQAINTG